MIKPKISGNSDAKVEDVCNSFEKLEMIPCENVDFEEEKRELLPEEHSESFLEDNADVEHSENNVNGNFFFPKSIKLQLCH